MIKIDFWHGESKRDVYFVDCFFYPDECIYRGNMYGKNHNIIGDFSSKDSVSIEKYFPGIFGN